MTLSTMEIEGVLTFRPVPGGARHGQSLAMALAPHGIAVTTVAPGVRGDGPAAEWASGTIVDLNGASYLR